MDRRVFLNRVAAGTLLMGAGSFPLEAMGSPEVTRLTILHTNDVHSRIEPFPMDGSERQGLGGVARRAALISRIRREEANVLLLDAGDIFQGTPYFNFYGGELEMKLMSEMGYDASTIGNHDFDAGIEGLQKQLVHATFPLINSNYDFSDTVMKGHTIPYKIFEKGKIKIGVTGVGIELKGLVPEAAYRDTRYLDPIAHANEMASFLKNEAHCDYVICLSHLGYKYEDAKVSDIALAQQSKNIDLIIGGHTHTFMKKPDLVRNSDGKTVVINQVGWAGMVLGRLDIYFENNYKKKCISCDNILINS